MSTSTDLRRIVGAMTDRPWKWSEQHRLEGPPYTDDYGSGPEVVRDTIIETDSGVYPPSDPDREAIAALANHADALVALVEACEAIVVAERILAAQVEEVHASYVPPGQGNWGFDLSKEQRSLSDAKRAMNAALAAVHAIRNTP